MPAENYLDPTGLSYYHNRIKTLFPSKSEFDTLDAKVDELITEGGEPNTIESISVNGTAVTPDAQKNVALTVPTSTSDLTNDGDGTSNFATEAYVATNGGKIDKITVNGTEQTITNKTVSLTIPTKVSDLQNDGDGTSGSEFATKSYVDTNGGKIDKIKVNGTEQTITNKEVDISVPTKVSDLTNDGDGTAGSTFATNSDVQTAISSAVASAYKYKGSVADMAALDAITTKEVGDVYDVQVTGMNYAWNGTAWDSLGTYVDMSLYWSKAELTAMTTTQIDALFE